MQLVHDALDLPVGHIELFRQRLIDHAIHQTAHEDLTVALLVDVFVNQRAHLRVGVVFHGASHEKTPADRRGYFFFLRVALPLAPDFFFRILDRIRWDIVINSISVADDVDTLPVLLVVV